MLHWSFQADVCCIHFGKNKSLIFWSRSSTQPGMPSMFDIKNCQPGFFYLWKYFRNSYHGSTFWNLLTKNGLGKTGAFKQFWMIWMSSLISSSASFWTYHFISTSSRSILVSYYVAPHSPPQPKKKTPKKEVLHFSSQIYISWIGNWILWFFWLILWTTGIVDCAPWLRWRYEGGIELR